MNQFQITSRPRHLRYFFFIDECYPYDELFKLICFIQGTWGGRYNPIIPVKNNVISDRYIALLKYYDPDYVFYSNGVDPEIIKKLRSFNPCGYYNLDEQPRKEDISGIDALYLLSQFDSNSKIIVFNNLWGNNSILLDYYKLNFGLEFNGYLSEYIVEGNNLKITVDNQNFDSLNKIIYQNKPVNRTHLSRQNLNTRILRNLEHDRFLDFEIVVSKDKTVISDLLYYWNRLLYGVMDIIYITVDELNLLSTDKYFGGVLSNMSIDNTVHVVSTTLSEDEIEELISTKFNPIAHYRRFLYKPILDFPFDILDDHGLYEREYGELSSTQTLVSEKGLFHIPKLRFPYKVGYQPQKWAVDIEIKKAGENHHNAVLFPLTTKTQYIIEGVKGRINRLRNISIVIHNQPNASDTLQISIPEIQGLVKQLIVHPVIHGEVQATKYIGVELHDSSKKLFAFFKSFEFNLDSIESYFTDKFWIGLFEELITSIKITGDSMYFDEIKSKCVEVMKQQGIEIGENGDSYKNIENLEIGLKKTIEELCNYRVFLKGFNLKCKKCSSKYWYHIKEISEFVNCKGCLEDFEFPIEPKFAYKLNDLIKNNIFQSKTSRDGNLTVIMTIVKIYKRTFQSFSYSPQLNLYNNYHSNKPFAEIDIVCLSDGQLIIGEAKHNSKAFFENNHKSLLSLVEVAKAIRPDKVILSCYEDRNDKLDRAKKYLSHLFYDWDYKPEIVVLHLQPANDFNFADLGYFYY